MLFESTKMSCFLSLGLSHNCSIIIMFDMHKFRDLSSEVMYVIIILQLWDTQHPGKESKNTILFKNFYDFPK